MPPADPPTISHATIAGTQNRRYRGRMSDQVRTRFAPSPTGYLHVGGARTALFNWLFARGSGGKFVLRVEDTDEERNTQEARQAILEGMRWLGMDWDEGPEVGGEFGPYFQSQRQDIYEKWFAKLQEAGRVYEDEGAWRFRFDRRPITMNDLVCGEVTIDYTVEDNTPDMVVRRSNGSFVFHFVNVVDDIEMKISHVLRGEDHLMNTPKHIQLFEAFGVTPPQFAHLPLLLNMDGSKISKRDDGASVGEYAERGFLQSAVVNLIALLGWSPKGEEEIFAIDELIERFSLENVNRAPAKFDWKKCAWINQQHLLKLSPADFAAAAKPYVEAAGLPIVDNYDAMVASVQEKVELLVEVPYAIEFYLKDPAPNDELREKFQKNEDAPRLLGALADNLRTIKNWDDAHATIAATAKEQDVKAGKLMSPLRVALSGRSGGPGLDDILAILGRDESLRRIELAIAQPQ